MRQHIDGTGFLPPTAARLGHEHRTVAVAELVTTAALALAIIVVATVVSVGMARADMIGNVIDNEGSLFAVSLLLGLLFIGMGGLTVLTLPHHLTLPGHKSKNHKRSHNLG
jgi:hypothetical protein